MKVIHTEFHTYIVECADGTFYTGKTIDVTMREKQHNGLLPGGAKYTKHRRPVKLVYYETHNSNKSAVQREITIKKLSRNQKVKLIQTAAVTFS